MGWTEKMGCWWIPNQHPFIFCIFGGGMNSLISHWLFFDKQIIVYIDKNVVSSSQSVNSVFTENTTKKMACKKLRAIFLCHYRVPNADFTRFFLPKSHDPVTLSLQFSVEGFSSRQWQVSIKIDKTARFMALG